MKINNLILGSICLLLLQIINPVTAQTIYNKMTEITERGRVLKLEPFSKKKDCNRIVLGDYANVDINSLIKIELDKEQIKLFAYNWLPLKSNLPVDRIKGISDILSKRLEIINQIQFTSPKLEDKRKVLESFSITIFGLLQVINALDSKNPLRTGVTSIFANPNLTASDKYNQVFDLLQAEIDAIGVDYKSNIEQNKVVFRLGTFINNTPVHLEGFDSYKEGDYYFVPPFITAIPEKQQQDFEEYQKLASQANENALKAFSGKLQEMLNPILDNLKTELSGSIYNPLNSFESAVNRMSNISKDVETEIAKNKEKLIKLAASVDLLKTNFEKTDQDNYLKNLTESISSVSDNYLDLKQSLNDLFSKFSNETLPEFQSALSDLKSGIENGTKLVNQQIEAIKSFIGSNILKQIGITINIDESLLKLGDEVSKIPLDNIQPQTILDLKKTVVRKNGDRLIFKAVLEKSLQKNNKPELITIDYTSIGLYQMGLHNSFEATLILANDLSGQFASKKQFQFAPAYSVLFKSGFRESSFYNNFLDFGLGLNVATLDFNKDDNPEVGIGLVFASFKDYLQVGYGRNFGVDQNYWFFGIRLPFLGMNSDGRSKMIPSEQ